MKNNEEDNLKNFSNVLRELAKDHPIVTPMQREELSEKEMEEYWKSIIDESKKRYSDMLLFPPETINEILQNYRDEERIKKYLKIEVLKRRDNNDLCRNCNLYFDLYSYSPECHNTEESGRTDKIIGQSIRGMCEIYKKIRRDNNGLF